MAETRIKTYIYDNNEKEIGWQILGLANRNHIRLCRCLYRKRTNGIEEESEWTIDTTIRLWFILNNQLGCFPSCCLTVRRIGVYRLTYLDFASVVGYPASHSLYSFYGD